MGLGLVLAGAAALAALPAAADDATRRGKALESLDQLKRACRRAQGRGARRASLYAVQVKPSQWGFGDYLPTRQLLPIDTSQNLRVFDGSAQLFPSALETIGFTASRKRARQLQRVARQGSRLRIGFFLGFDDPHGTKCLLRPPVGVTTVRMDVAYIEMVTEQGDVVAREDTDRLRAWLDDLEQDRVPGSGPRGVLGAAMRTAGAGTAPESWQRTLGSAHQGKLGRALGQCHAAGLERGARGRGQVVVRVTVRPDSGRIEDTKVELSSIGDDKEARCIARALDDHLELPAAPDAFAKETVDISVPVQLAR